MAELSGLERLLRELAAAASPTQRVRTLARGWRILRTLEGSQLRELAVASGLERAEGFLRKLARQKGRPTPALIREIAELIRDVEPTEVVDLADGVRDRRRRDELLRRGAEVIDRWVDEGAPGDSPVPDAPEPAVRSEPAEPAEPAEPVEPVEQAEPVATEDRRRLVVVPVAAAAAVAAAEPIPYRSTAESAEAGEPAAAQDEVERILARMRAAPSSVQRLRRLRAELPRMRGLEVDRLREILDELPAGWVRRRALDALLRAGLPRRLVHAVYLIEQLASPLAERWCTSTLLATRELSPDERAALLARHGRRPRRPRAAAGSDEG